MKARELYNILFTEYDGPVGFAPAVVTLAVVVALGASVLYGGVMLGKAALAHGPAVETGHSSSNVTCS